MRVPGDVPDRSDGLPRPPVVVRSGLDGFLDTWGQFIKLWTDTLPYLAARLAIDVDGHKGTGRLPKY